MKTEDLKGIVEWKRIDGRVYMVHENDDARYFLTVDDLYRLIDILNNKNGIR